MLINKFPYHEDETETLMNIISRNNINVPYINGIDFLKKKYIKFPGMRSIDIFKTVFGRQLKCVQYTLKNWIWTFSNDEKSCVIYCLVNIEGICWECNKHFSDINDILKLKHEIQEKIINYK